MPDIESGDFGPRVLAAVSSRDGISFAVLLHASTRANVVIPDFFKGCHGILAKRAKMLRVIYLM